MTKAFQIFNMCCYQINNCFQENIFIGHHDSISLLKILKVLIQLISWFSITQILREINVWDSESAKSPILAYSETLHFDFEEFLHFFQS